MLEVQKYLSNHTLQNLIDEFGIKVKEYEDRLVLNYDQIDSPKFHPIVKECRALILSYDYKVLSRAFDRFFNLSEDPNEKEFDISSAILYEKIDGSICPCYFDGKKWQVATRGTAFGEGMSNRGNKSYRDIFFEALGSDNLDYAFANIPTEYTVIFEMVSPETRVVKPYSESKIYLIGIRNKETGEDLPISVANDWICVPGVRWFYPKYYKFTSYDEILKSIRELPALDEGYVVVAEGFYRIKIKNPSYLAIANLRMNGIPSDRRIAWLVWHNDYDEYLSYFPEDKTLFDVWIEARKKLMEDINANLHHMNIKVQKDFALTIQNCKCKSVLFSIRKGDSLQKIFDRMSENSIIALLENYRK